jgi:hypothetical protein
MGDAPLPHCRKDIWCPLEKQDFSFSPRLLPNESGYRILSLDGGGVKGLALLVMLKHIEKRCFGIPLIYLFDLVVGTGTGGQIALTLNTCSQTSSGPLAVTTAVMFFRELTKVAFQGKVKSFVTLRRDKVVPLERQLKDHFGEEPKLFSGEVSQPYPNVAVTTVGFQSPDTYLVAN